MIQVNLTYFYQKQVCCEHISKDDDRTNHSLVQYFQVILSYICSHPLWSVSYVNKNQVVRLILQLLFNGITCTTKQSLTLHQNGALHALQYQ